MSFFEMSEKSLQVPSFLSDDQSSVMCCFLCRSGDTVRLADLLDEGLKRATEKLEAKGKERFEGNEDEARRTAEALAYGCIKYADLSNNRNHEYVFSFDKMLEDKGNTAVYMLYAYTRYATPMDILLHP